MVIANAGISVGIDTEVFEDLEVMRSTFETNVIGMAATFHPFLRAMRERNSGTLVGIASVAGIRDLPGHGAYCSSKAAVISYCEPARRAARQRRARGGDALCYIATPLTQRNRYGMPFLLRAEDFAERAFRAVIGRARATASFPGRWAWWPS